ncbi:MAG: GNAT family N-acetyltransferase [Pseudomonadales bacterium]|nr:GNAT family N-acetyltransferase [Pseudomonadales bacterium]
MIPGLEIVVAETEAAIRACWPVMAQLRPQLDEGGFLERVQRQRAAGYRLVAVRRGGRVVAVAGFVIGEKLAWGRHLYVDDLVTDEAARSGGVGAALLAWLRRHAAEAGCAELHLDSGVQRTDAHRFYAREGLAHASQHFRVAITEADRSDRLVPPVVDDEPDEFDPSHEGGLDPDFR